MNVILLMAGEGKRFKDAGYETPKPLIEISYKNTKMPLFQAVIENLFDVFSSKINKIIILKRSDYEIDLSEMYEDWNDYITIVNVEKTTEGALCTALLASEYLYGYAKKESVLITNCDQLIEVNKRNFNTFYSKLQQNENFLFTFETKDDSTKWSFATTYSNERIKFIKEKVKISNLATCGLYYFGSFNDFKHYAEIMIDKNDRFNNEFYLAPVYNYTIGNHNYHFVVDKFYGLGVPEDLEKYEAEILNKHAIMGM